MSLVQYNDPAIQTAVAYYTGTDVLYEGYILEYAANADPENSAFGPVKNADGTRLVGMAVIKPTVTANLSLVAGVVGPSSDGMTGPGQVELLIPTIGQVVKIAVAVAVDAGDGIAIQTEYYGSDGSTWATGDLARALFDEDNANNPYGTSALTAAIGYVDAVWTKGL